MPAFNLHRSTRPTVRPAGCGRVVPFATPRCDRSRKARVTVVGVADNGAGTTVADVGAKRVLVLGGTGRVGSSTASALLKHFPSLKVSIASRQKGSYEKALERRPELQGTDFIPCDITDMASVKAALDGVDLIIHTAGPFQQSQNDNVIQAAIATKTPYVDVCDDTAYSLRMRSYADAAKAAGVPCITTGGIYPGTSNVMAAHIIAISRGEYDENWNYRTPEPGSGVEPKLLRYSYYTAGSGGAGPTILETSFLIAGEPCIVYRDGGRFVLPAISNRRLVDFGPGVGRKGTFLWNLPEVASAYECMGVQGVSARFGTDPFIWNWAMWLIAHAVPRNMLNSRAFVKTLAAMSDPWVRLVDKFVGEAVAMRIEVDLEGDKNASGIFVHKLLSQSMGYSVAGFAWASLSGQTQPGVWYPEQREAVSDRRGFLKIASTGCSRFVVNQPLWALESPVKQLGGLVYW